MLHDASMAWLLAGMPRQCRTGWRRWARSRQDLGRGRAALLGAVAMGLAVGAIGAWLAFSRRARPGTR